MLVRPAMPHILDIEVPDLDTVCDTFTETPPVPCGSGVFLSWWLERQRPGG
jgi:hypothetical protein